MFETFGGLPLHPLVVHAVVVLGPLAALCLVAYAVVPRWRVGLRWPTLLLAAAAAGAGYVAKEAGEYLRDALFPDQVPPPVAEHAAAGDLAAISLYLLLGVTLIVLLLVPAREAARVPAIAGLVLALGAAAFAGYAGFEAGHSGATAVWGGMLR